MTPMRALIIDDSLAMRAILRRLLLELGFEVHDAADAKAADAVLAKIGKAEVALVDWNLPGESGLDFVKRRRGAGTRFLMVTTETEPARVAEALAAGADEYLMKPFTKEALVEKLALLGIKAGASDGA